MGDSENLIRLNDLSKVYRTDSVETTALRDINIDVNAGEFVVLGYFGISLDLTYCFDIQLTSISVATFSLEIEMYPFYTSVWPLGCNAEIGGNNLTIHVY